MHLLDFWQSSASKFLTWLWKNLGVFRLGFVRKIRNVQAWIKRIWSGINQPSTSCTVHKDFSWYKHQLLTTIASNGLQPASERRVQECSFQHLLRQLRQLFLEQRNIFIRRQTLTGNRGRIDLRLLQSPSHDFRFWCTRREGLCDVKVWRTRFCSCAFGTLKLARTFSTWPSASRWVYSVYLVYFWCFCPFQFFIVPLYRTITKNISEPTCGKSRLISALSSFPLRIFLPSLLSPCSFFCLSPVSPLARDQYGAGSSKSNIS